MSFLLLTSHLESTSSPFLTIKIMFIFQALPEISISSKVFLFLLWEPFPLNPMVLCLHPVSYNNSSSDDGDKDEKEKEEEEQWLRRRRGEKDEDEDKEERKGVGGGRRNLWYAICFTYIISVNPQNDPRGLSPFIDVITFYRWERWGLEKSCACPYAIPIRRWPPLSTGNVLSLLHGFFSAFHSDLHPVGSQLLLYDWVQGVINQLINKCYTHITYTQELLFHVFCPFSWPFSLDCHVWQKWCHIVT